MPNIKGLKRFIFGLSLVSALASARCEPEAYFDPVIENYTVAQSRVFRFAELTSVDLVREGDSMSAFSNRRLSEVFYQQVFPELHGQRNMLSERRLATPKMQKSLEGTYRFGLRDVGDGEIFLDFEERYGVEAADSLGGYFGIGPFLLEIRAPVHFTQGSLEDYNAGKRVAFELSPEGCKSAAQQTARALALWTESGQAAGGDRFANESFSFVEHLFGHISSELAKHTALNWTEAESTADLTEVLTRMSRMTAEINKQRIAQQQVRIEKVPESFCLHFRGSQNKMSIVFSPAQEYVIRLYL